MNRSPSSSASELQHVWTPLTIGGVTVKHRIMSTAHTLYYAENGLVSDRHIAYYRERAKGGAALLSTGGHFADRLTRSAFYCVAWDKRNIPHYARLADAVHEYGCKQFVQLFCLGSQHGRGTERIDEFHPLWAPSRVPSLGGSEMPAVMEQEQIDIVIRGHRDSAANVRAAGLDGVELHAGHSSSLLGQFMSPAYNKRTDRYGGSPARRCQLVIEAAAAIREEVGADLMLGVRISFDEFRNEAGIVREQSEEQLDVLASTGLFDYFSISGGAYDAIHLAVASMAVAEGYMVPFAARARAIVGERARLFIVGRILDVAMADEIVASGAADMVGMTRAQIADPFLVKKAREGRDDEIIRCVGVNECLARNFEGREVVCMMNPTVGREREWGEGTLRRVGAGEARRIAVVGGGPAGLKLAEVAARRGHEVVLFERERELGGHLDLLKRLPTRAGWQVAIDNLAGAAGRAGVELRLGVEAGRELLERERPDVVVCATGSRWDRTGFSPLRPEREGIPGAGQENVLDVGLATRRALADPGSLGRRVLILDETGYYLPLGLAEVLAAAGVQVEVMTRKLSVGLDTFRTAEAGHVLPRLAAAGVKLTAGHFVESIAGGVVEVYDVWGGPGRSVTVDTVVLSMTRSPNDDLFRELGAALPEVMRVGDALAPRVPLMVIYEAEELGRRL